MKEAALYSQMRNQQELVFNNEYAARARELETEVQNRLGRVGILGPYGTQAERRVLTGFFTGPHPILECADYLERIARRLQ